jgi:hypothetical protein
MAGYACERVMQRLHAEWVDTNQNTPKCHRKQTTIIRIHLFCKSRTNQLRADWERNAFGNPPNCVMHGSRECTKNWATKTQKSVSKCEKLYISPPQLDGENQDTCTDIKSDFLLTYCALNWLCNYCTECAVIPLWVSSSERIDYIWRILIAAISDCSSWLLENWETWSARVSEAYNVRASEIDEGNLYRER